MLLHLPGRSRKRHIGPEIRHRPFQRARTVSMRDQGLARKRPNTAAAFAIKGFLDGYFPERRVPAEFFYPLDAHPLARPPDPPSPLGAWPRPRAPLAPFGATPRSPAAPLHPPSPDRLLNPQPHSARPQGVPTIRDDGQVAGRVDRASSAQYSCSFRRLPPRVNRLRPHANAKHHFWLHPVFEADFGRRGKWRAALSQS